MNVIIDKGINLKFGAYAAMKTIIGNKKIVVSVHDITPCFHDECRIIFNKLETLGVHQRTLLITPDFAGKYPIDRDEKFIIMMEREKQKGFELALHGYTHKHFEFYKKNYIEARESLQQGMEIFENAFGFLPKGFVAPHWLQSNSSLKAVEDLGFNYTVALRTLKYFNGKEYKTFPLNFDWGNSFLNRIVAAGNKFTASLRKTGLIRFAVHPMDIPNGVFNKEMKILKKLIVDGWEPVSYENLIL
jgi:predicted deacetylase